MKCAQQTRPLAITLALASVIRSAVGSLQLDFVDEYTYGSVSVGVGSPPTQYNLVIDTASSGTWIGAGKSYAQTSTSKDTGDTVSVSYYGGNSMSGNEYIDQVTLSNQLVVAKQSIGVATQSAGFQGSDGLLGLGPTDLTEGTVSGQGTVPTVLDNLVGQGTIQDKVIHIGQQKITFGGFDDTLFVGTINYVPITSSSPASQYWGVDANFAYSGTTLLQGRPGIVDYLHTTISFTKDAFEAFLTATGARIDQTTGLPVLNSCSRLKTLDLTLGGQTYRIPPQYYTWPRDQNTAIGGVPGKCYLAVDQTDGSSDGIDFFLGYNTLKHYNVVLDATNSRVGIVEAVLDINL